MLDTLSPSAIRGGYRSGPADVSEFGAKHSLVKGQRLTWRNEMLGCQCTSSPRSNSAGIVTGYTLARSSSRWTMRYWSPSALELHVLGHIYGTRGSSCRVFAIKSSAVRETADGALSSDQNGRAASVGPSDSSAAEARSFKLSNTVGILGGLSPLATVDFMRKLIDATDAQVSTGDIPVLLCSDLHVRKKVTSNMETSQPVSKASTALEVDYMAPLLDKRRFLEQAGVRCIVMPCHISHVWYNQLAEGCTVQFLNMADCVVKELLSMDLRPLEGGTKPKIGVLGSKGTLAAGFYQEKLKSQGFDVLVPDKATMEHAVIPGISNLERRDFVGARHLLRIGVQLMLVNAANMVVLACHDMPTAFSSDDPILKKCIDPTDALARAAIRCFQL